MVRTWACWVLVAAACSVPGWSGAGAQAAGGAGAWELCDNTGDVRLVDPSNPVAVPSSAVADLVDIHCLVIPSESGLDFGVEYRVSALSSALPNAVSVAHVVCFETGGTLVALRVTYLVPGGGETPQNALAVLFRMPQGTCDLALPGASGQARPDVVLDASTQTIRLVVLKADLLRVVGTGLMIHAGDSFQDFRAFSFTRDEARSHIDAMPDQGSAPDPYVLVAEFHNQHLKVSAPTAATAGVLQCSGFTRPIVAVEAGRYQAVPVTVSSDANEPLRVALTAEPVDAGWEAKIIPSIDVPAATVEGLTGNATVTLIVRSPSTAAKECGAVRILATDPTDPLRTGEMVLDVVASPVLDADARVLHLHTRHDAPLGKIWMNAADEDPTEDAAYERRFVPPLQPQVGSSSKFRLSAEAEAAYPYDILLDSEGTATARLHLRSDPVLTNARLSIEFKAGGELMAFGSRVVQVPTSPTDLAVDLLVEPDVWRSPERRAPADQPFELTILYEPLTPNPDVPTPEGQGAGYVYFTPGKSSLELPIVGTLLARESRLGADGGLVSLQVEGDRALQFVNEGKGVFFNFTATNEGVGPDSFTVMPNVTSEPPLDWRVEVVDASSITGLDPGARGRFGILVAAPAAAPEGARARIRVVVDSGHDDAQATALVEIQVANQEPHGVTLEAPEAQAGGDSPSLGSLGMFAALSVAFGVLARRRQRAG